MFMLAFKNAPITTPSYAGPAVIVLEIHAYYWRERKREREREREREGGRERDGG
jgi:hypothetical protein